MTKLSDTQLVLLSSAARRDDSAIVIPTKLKGHASQAIEAMLSRKLCKAIPKSGELPLWRREPDGPLSLIVTPKGLEAIGIESGSEHGKSRIAAKPHQPQGDRPKRKKTSKVGPAASKKPRPTARANSKIAQVIDMLRKPGGVTIKAIMMATGWQAHSVRGAISGAIKKKLGLNVATEQRGEERFYRIGV